MCNIGEFMSICPDSCNLMTSNLPTRGGTFIGNEYRSDIKVRVARWIKPNFRLYVFGPSALKDYVSAMLRCKI